MPERVNPFPKVVQEMLSESTTKGRDWQTTPTQLPPVVQPAGAWLIGGSLAPFRRVLQSRRRILLYAVIGGTALAMDLVVFLLLSVGLGWSPLPSHGVSVPISGLYSFTMNARFNFRQTTQWRARLASFAAVATLGYVVGAMVIWIIVNGFQGPGLAAKLMSLPLVFAIQYRLNTKVTFNPAGVTAR